MGWQEFFRRCTEAGGPVHLVPTARAAGLDPQRVRRRAAAEGWWRPYPDVVAPPGTPIDQRTWTVAATVHARGQARRAGNDLAAVSGRSALALLGVRRVAPTRVEVMIPAGTGVLRAPRLRVVRSRHFGPADVRHVDGIPVLAGAPLLRRLARDVDPAGLRAVAVDLVAAGHTTIGRLGDELRRCPRFPGRVNLAAVAAELAAAGRTDSPFELRVRRRLEAAGVPLDRGQVAVTVAEGRTIHLDLGLAAARFGIEVESFAWHAGRRHLDRDVQRANAIASAAQGWQVLRVTWGMLDDDWPAFLAQVRDVLAAQSRRYLDAPWPAPDHVRG